MSETSTAVMQGGSFYGAVRHRQEAAEAIFTDLQHSSARKLPQHAHQLAFFAVLLDGDYHERLGHEQKHFGPYTVAYRPAGIPHQDEIGPKGVRFFEIELRPSWRNWIDDCSGNLENARDECGGGEMLWLAMHLFRETRVPREPSDLCLKTLLAELVGAVARLPREKTHCAPLWLGRVLGKLESDYCERLTLDDLAQEAGVHPVHLSRVFRKCVGQGIGEYLHRLRIRAACEQMLTPQNSLAEISLATGFADQSHFTRIFRRVTGTSPAAFRKLVTPSVEYSFAAD